MAELPFNGPIMKTMGLNALPETNTQSFKDDSSDKVHIRKKASNIDVMIKNLGAIKPINTAVAQQTHGLEGSDED